MGQGRLRQGQPSRDTEKEARLQWGWGVSSALLFPHPRLQEGQALGNQISGSLLCSEAPHLLANEALPQFIQVGLLVLNVLRGTDWHLICIP